MIRKASMAAVHIIIPSFLVTNDLFQQRISVVSDLVAFREFLKLLSLTSFLIPMYLMIISSQ